MPRMGHDSPAAALLYQHSSRPSDEAIAAALDARLSGPLSPVDQAPENGPWARMGPDKDDSTESEPD